MYCLPVFHVFLIAPPFKCIFLLYNLGLFQKKIETIYLQNVKN